MILGAFLMVYAFYDKLPVIGPLLAKPKPVGIPLTGKQDRID
jgi:hypothetical protein